MGHSVESIRGGRKKKTMKVGEWLGLESFNSIGGSINVVPGNFGI